MQRAEGPGVPLVLGCARLGSALTPLDRPACIALLRQAYELGIRHFDTASIYGQGDSERFLGEALQAQRAEVSIATKAGQRLTPRQALLARLKPPIRWLAARRAGVRRQVATRRERGVPRCFEPDFIERSLRGSLQRLRSERVEVFYLHAPAPAVLADDHLFDRLEAMRRRGWFGRLGVSCDDAGLAWAAARHEAVQVVQLAFDDAGTALLAALAHRGKQAVLRGFVQGPGHEPAAAPLAQRLAQALAAPAAAGLVVGTTRIDHLRENLAAFRHAQALRITHGAIA